MFGRWVCVTDVNTAVSYWFRHLGGYDWYSNYGLTLVEDGNVAKIAVAPSGTIGAKLGDHRKAFMADAEMLYISRQAENNDQSFYKSTNSDAYGLYNCWLRTGTVSGHTYGKSINSFTVPNWEYSGLA